MLADLVCKVESRSVTLLDILNWEGAPEGTVQLAPRAGAGDEDVIQSIVSLIERCRSPQQLTGSRLATDHGLRLDALCRGIRVRTGHTLRRLLAAARIRPVLHPLITGVELVSQIAFSCAYESAIRLDRDFDRVLSLTPTEVRDLARLLSAARTDKKNQL